MGMIRYAVAAQLVVLAASSHVTSSLAADAPSRSPAGVAPSAFYVGVQGGVVWAQDKVQQYSTIIPLFRLDLKSDAAFGGLHVGYQRVIDNIIVGLEADYDWGGKQGAGAGSSSGTTLGRTFQIDGRGALRAKFGYDFGAFALYATGGAALAGLKTTASASTTSVIASDTSFAFGGTLGAGAIYRVSPHWAAFTEYRYSNYGESTVTTENGLPSGAGMVHKPTESSVRAGMTYYFR